jgi:hypothetical protein
MKAFPESTAPAEAPCDPIAELRQEFDARLDAVVSWAAAEFAQRDARIDALEAELRKLDAAADLDGEPRPWINIKRAAHWLGVSPEWVRLRCVSGYLDAGKSGGKWRVFASPDGKPLERGS